MTHAEMGRRADETSYGVFSSGWTEWTDYLSWSPTTDILTLVFEVSVHGTLHAGYTGTRATQASGVTWTNFHLSAPNLRSSPGNSSFGKYDSVSSNTGDERTSFYHEESVFLRYLFTTAPEQAGTSINLFLQSYAAAGSLSEDGSATAGTNFLSTAKLTDLQFLDASGRNVTSEVSYGFANGTQIYSDSTVTPEPMSIALLGTGLAGLLVARRRRRRETGRL